MKSRHMFVPVMFSVLCLTLQVFLFAGISSAQESTPEVDVRWANGTPVEGTFSSASPEGLTVQSARGTKVLPWKYLSTGTRWRYERPMLAELEAKRIREEKAAKAKAEAAVKAAAAKAAAAANTNKPAAAAAKITQPKATVPVPPAAASNQTASPTAK